MSFLLFACGCMHIEIADHLDYQRAIGLCYGAQERSPLAAKVSAIAIFSIMPQVQHTREGRWQQHRPTRIAFCQYMIDRHLYFDLG